MSPTPAGGHSKDQEGGSRVGCATGSQVPVGRALEAERINQGIGSIGGSGRSIVRGSVMVTQQQQQTTQQRASATSGLPVLRTSSDFGGSLRREAQVAAATAEATAEGGTGGAGRGKRVGRRWDAITGSHASGGERKEGEGEGGVSGMERTTCESQSALPPLLPLEPLPGSPSSPSLHTFAYSSSPSSSVVRSPATASIGGLSSRGNTQVVKEAPRDCTECADNEGRVVVGSISELPFSLSSLLAARGAGRKSVDADKSADVSGDTIREI